MPFAPPLADAAVIAIDIVSAGTLGTTLAAGIVAAAKMFIAFLDRHDTRVTTELTASRTAIQEQAGVLLSMQQQSVETQAELTGVINRLADRMDRWQGKAGTDEHEPLGDGPKSGKYTRGHRP